MLLLCTDNFMEVIELLGSVLDIMYNFPPQYNIHQSTRGEAEPLASMA